MLRFVFTLTDVDIRRRIFISAHPISETPKPETHSSVIFIPTHRKTQPAHKIAEAKTQESQIALGAFISPRNSVILLSHRVLSVHLHSDLASNRCFCEENMLPVEVIDNELVTFAASCPTLQELELQCFKSLVEGGRGGALGRGRWDCEKEKKIKKSKKVY
ncbi:hypothetical protein V8G54_006885 [Vigna mungo]|uniref:Uncharacterized protein n=1 Tax=Vigna mungo TaxID=3915 RepID=A0AAQ3S7S9_VIGMU